MIDYKAIKLVVFDLDGVLTDGHYYVGDRGEVSKSFYTRDFYAIAELVKYDIQVLILTQSHDKVIERQIERIREHSAWWKIICNDNKLLLKTGVVYKNEYLSCIAKEYSISYDDIAYMGDAENDLPCMKEVGITACPSDAVPIIKENSNYISDFAGGQGCVYDFVMHILKERTRKENENITTKN